MASPLFILSFRHRDELIRTAEAGGWQPMAGRRHENAEARFVASGAAVAVVDARGALEEGKDAVRSIGDAVEANAASLLVLLSRNDSEALEEFHLHGATHFLVSPFSEGQLVQAFRFALRHSERVGGRRARPAGEETDSWRWQKGSRTVDLSPALARKAGLEPEDGARIGLMELFRKLDPDGRRAARGAINRVLETGRATAFAHEDGEAVGGRLAHHVRGEPDGDIVGRAEAIPAHVGGWRAARDPLTGLGDAAAARAWLRTALGKSDPIVLLLLSVSRYDAINAAFGRSVGDAVLQAAARRIERRSDPDSSKAFVARMAGAEFAVLLPPPTTLEEGRFLAGDLVEAIGRPFVSGDHVITLASRVGVAISKAEDDAATLLRRASVALAEARTPESAPVRVLEQGVESETARGARLEVDLRRALDQGQIELRFQPQVSILSGEIVGAEALARWNHPEYGELGAATLFSVAERSDYLVQLSDHVQRRAIEAAAAWPAMLRPLRLSINITAADIRQPGFAGQLLSLVEASRFDRGRLTVEMTESGLIEDLGGAAALLAELRGGGLRVAIDDFGTGYSSLAYLKALPLDYLKIDKRLSQDITGSARDRVVVRSVIEMARSLGLEVIAEGVETEAQLALLAEEGCSAYQGFLCSAPVSTGELAELVARRAGPGRLVGRAGGQHRSG